MTQKRNLGSIEQTLLKNLIIIHKVIFSKTMMEGGRLHNEDPMSLVLYFGFCRVLKTIEPHCEEVGYRGKENLL